jgi:hypothetical protein
LRCVPNEEVSVACRLITPNGSFVRLLLAPRALLGPSFTAASAVDAEGLR